MKKRFDKFTWIALAASLWYALGACLFFFIDIVTLSVPQPWYAICAMLFVLYGYEGMPALVWAPVAFAVLGIIGAVRKSEQSKARRVCYGVLPALGSLFSVYFLTALAFDSPGSLLPQQINFDSALRAAFLVNSAIFFTWTAAEIVFGIKDKKS